MDVSPQINQARRILFLPDPNQVFDPNEPKKNLFDVAADDPEAHKFVQLARERYDIYHEYRKTGAREVYISDADRQRIFVIEEAMRQILSRIF